MALGIHDYFKFYTSNRFEDEVLDFPEPGRVVNYTTLSGSSNWWNGITYEEWVPENEADGDYTYNELLWTYSKLYSEHPVTSGEVDKTRGNRIFAIPVLVERLADSTDIYISASHILADKLRFIQWTSVTKTLIVEGLGTNQNLYDQDNFTSLVGKRVAVGCLQIEPGVFSTGLGSLSYNYYQDWDEYVGTISAISGRRFTIILDVAPADNDFTTKIDTIAPINQKVSLIPHGRVLTGVPQYNTRASQIGLSDWTYYEGTGRTPQKIIQTPRIKVSLPAIGDKFKFMMQVERDLEDSVVSHGLLLTPVAVT